MNKLYLCPEEVKRIAEWQAEEAALRKECENLTREQLILKIAYERAKTAFLRAKTK